MNALETTALALALTALIEWLVYAIVLRRGLISLFLASLLVNALTQPIGSVIVLFQSTWMTLVLVELGVVTIEAILLTLLLKLRAVQAAGLSVVANSASALIGVALFWIR